MGFRALTCLMATASGLVLMGCDRGALGDEQGPGIHVANAEARACDLVLALEGGGEARIEFRDHVLGAAFQRGARVGVSVTARSDSELGTVARVPADTANLQEATCFDRAGRKVEQPSVSLR